MGIFDFFKKITKEDKIKKSAIENLAFFEIEDWIENKIKENQIKEKEILLEIGEKIMNFTKELREKIIILRSFDVEAKKEEDKIKNIVIDSREKYIEFVEELIEKLDILKEPKLEKFIEKINKIFFEFDKKSSKNYERATILIGKEMASIKESLKVFSKNLLKIFNESKPLMDFFNNLLAIRGRLYSIIQINKTLEGINERKSNLSKKMGEKEKENRILKQNLEGVKISHLYLENLSKQKKIESLRVELRNNILELKQLLDFKALASFFHINPEQMKIVKNHREDFQTNFEKDNGLAIIELLNEAKLNNDIILGKVNQIKSKIEEIKNSEQEIKKDETLEINSQIKGVSLEIDNLKIERVKEEKREERLRTDKEELISSLNQELIKVNVEIV